MNIGNALINSLIVSSLILIAAMIFGVKGERQQTVRRPSRRAKRRSSVETKTPPRPRAGGIVGGR